MYAKASATECSKNNALNIVNAATIPQPIATDVVTTGAAFDRLPGKPPIGSASSHLYVLSFTCIFQKRSKNIEQQLIYFKFPFLEFM
jgi:hypothetical protein